MKTGCQRQGIAHTQKKSTYRQKRSLGQQDKYIHAPRCGRQSFVEKGGLWLTTVHLDVHRLLALGKSDPWIPHPLSSLMWRLLLPFSFSVSKTHKHCPKLRDSQSLVSILELDAWVAPSSISDFSPSTQQIQRPSPSLYHRFLFIFGESLIFNQ